MDKKRYLTLIRQMECPLCMEYLTHEILQCKNGHSFCGTCRRALTKCAICRCLFSNARNYALESLAEFLVYPCKFAANGCEEFRDKTEKHEHELNCVFKTHYCRIKAASGDGCAWAGPKIKLEKHCQDEHTARAWMQEENLDRWKPGTDDSGETQLIKAHGELFYLTRKLDDATSVMHWALHYIGPDAATSEYVLFIGFVSEEQDMRSLCVNEVCHNYDKDMDDIIKSGKSIGITCSTLHTFVNDFKSIWYKVQVKKK